MKKLLPLLLLLPLMLLSGCEQTPNEIVMMSDRCDYYETFIEEFDCCDNTYAAWKNKVLCMRAISVSYR